MSELLLLSTTLCVTLAAVGLLLSPLRRFGVLDVPGSRSSHHAPTPRGGGIAVVLGLMAGSGVAALAGSPPGVAFGLGLIGISAVGLTEDLRGVAIPVRLILQCGFAVLSTGLLLGLEVPSAVLLSALLVVAQTNAFNFMDGINGISALSTLVAGSWYWWVADDGSMLSVVGMLLIGSALGFLPWNAPTARVFLGDVGSYALGFAVSYGALLALHEGVDPLVALAPLAVYGADTSWTLLRRARAGRTWHEAHREHVYQRLTDEAGSHARVAVFVALTTVAVCAASAIPGPRLMAALAMACILAGYLGSVRAVRTFRVRRAGIRAGGPTRVLHVSAVDFTATRLLLPQLKYLKQSDCDVRIACGRTNGADWETLALFEPVDLRFPRSLNPIRMVLATWRLYRVVRDWRPEILHLHTPAAGLPVRLVPRFLWPSELRIVYTVHGYLHPWPPVSRRDRIVQRLERFLSGRTDLTLFQSSEDLAEAKARSYGGCPTLLGNGVEDSWFEIPDRARDPELDLQVLFVGRLVKEKGILDLLEAVTRTPRVRLHVAGSPLPSDRDPVADKVADVVARPGLHGRVVLHGMLTKPELLALYEKVDVLCLPSYREGVPRSVIEALAAGRPVIASRIRGCRELIVDGRNGILHEPRDIAGIVAALTTVARMPVGPFSDLARAARASADPDLRESIILHRLRRNYDMLLAQTSTTSNDHLRERSLDA